MRDILGDILVAREQELEEAISDLLAIIDGKEHAAEAFCAWNHGIRCDPEVSKRNGKTIEAAYELLGRKRHEDGD